MAFEVTCGQCQGRLLVDAGGVVVECPLCGAHLSIPAWEDATPTLTSEPASVLAKSAIGLPEPIGAASHVGSSIVSGGLLSVSEPVVHPTIDTEPPTAITSVVDEPDASSTLLEVISHSYPNLMQELSPPESITSHDAAPAEIDEAPTIPDFSTGESPDVVAFATMEPTELMSSPVVQGFTTSPERAAINAPVQAPAPSSQIDVVPRQWFVIVASYASAATMVALYLLYSLLTVPTQQLESLPDLVPQIRKSDGEVSLVVPPIDARLPAGHDLRIGESQRFGSLRVTPLKIVRGRLNFEHAFGKAKAAREPSPPVLKLWLRFDNVSRDQIFPPLDRTLVFKRVFQGVGKPELANQFARETSQTRADGIRFFTYGIPENSEFILAGQNLGADVKPGESWETFIPLEEVTQELNGPCVWRVQFRKGYHPRSGRGVTTLIDVHFETSEIHEEQAA